MVQPINRTSSEHCTVPQLVAFAGLGDLLLRAKYLFVAAEVLAMALRSTGACLMIVIRG